MDVEKLTPKVPHISSDGYYPCCPNCYEEVSPDAIITVCPICSQLIRWDWLDTFK